MVSRLVQRAWTSPTLTTWASFLTRSLNLLVILPLAVDRLSAAEVQIWQMVLSVGIMLMFLDLGLSPTFTRFFARSVVTAGEAGSRGATDYGRVEQTWRTMFFIYGWAARLGGLPVLLIGWLALKLPISDLEQPAEGWWALGAVALTSPLGFLALGYTAFLQGLNHVALVRRWEALFGLGAVATNLGVLMLGGGLLELVVATQVWTVLAVLRNRMLAFRVDQGRARQFGKAMWIRSAWAEAWPAVWRSGVGVVLTSGFIQASGLLYAQFGRAAEVAAYLLALRYLTAISQFAQAPFYSRIPALARLQAQGDTPRLLALAERGMRLSHLTFAAAATTAAYVLPWVFTQVEGEVAFVSPSLWWLFVFAIFLERFGAMHLQLYSTTNHIVWHKAGGWSGAIIITVSLLSIRHLGAYAVPIGMVVAYAGFYCWYCAMKSYREFQIPILRFELRTTGLPLVILLLGALGNLLPGNPILGGR